MEYLRTNNYKIALLCFNEAINTFKEDPIIYNEVGVVFYKQRKYKTIKKDSMMQKSIF